MSKIGAYISPRWEHFKLCWEHAQEHWGISMLLILFAAYNFFASMQPLVDVPHLPFDLPKLSLPWVMVIILAGITFMVAEGGYRLRQKELGQEHNLHLESILKGTMGVGLYQQPKISLFFRNQSRPTDAVATASVRAELRYKRGQEMRSVSPLSWLGSTASAVDIGVGETAELVIGMQNAGGMWDFGVNASAGPTDAIWIDEVPFEFEIRLLNAKNGRPLKIQEPLTFRWEWRETSGHTSRPWVVLIDPPQWTL